MKSRFYGLLKYLALSLTLFVHAQSANAVPIEVEYNDATASLELIGTAINIDGTTTYTIEYVFDFTGWDVSGTCASDDDTCGAERATHLLAVHFSFGGSESPDATLISVTPSTVGGVSLTDTVANSGGCAANGGSNNVCAEINDPWLAPIFDTTGAGNTYTFQFEVTYSDTFVVDIEDANIRAAFSECTDADNCTDAGLMSLRTKVPEPGTLGLLGLGLIGIGLQRRRRRHNSA